MENSNKEIMALVELLDKKYKLLYEILNLTNNQTKAIKDNKFDKLDNLIMVKQTYIDRINNIDDTFIKRFNKIKELYDINDITEISDIDMEIKNKLKEITNKVLEILKEISEIENTNKELINKSFQEVKLKLKNIKKGKKVTSSYYKKPMQTGGYFIDKGR